MAGIDFLKEYHHIKKDVPIHYTQVCVDQSRFFPDENRRTALREKMGVAKEDRILVSMGKVVPLKKFDLLIRAMAQVPKEHRVRAWIIGGGDQGYIESLKRLAQEKGCPDVVDFMENVPHEDLPAYFNAEDMGFWNRSTSSIQEAMSCGLPIIVPSCVAGVLPEYGSGQVFGDDLVPDLVYAISRLASDERYAKISAGRSLTTAKKRFDVAAQAKEIIALYDAALNK